MSGALESHGAGIDDKRVYESTLFKGEPGFRHRDARVMAAKRDGTAERLLARLERFIESGEVPAAFVARLGELAAAGTARRAA